MILTLVLIITLLYFLAAYSTYQYLQMLNEVFEPPMSRAAVLLGAVRWPFAALFMFYAFEIRKDPS